MKIDLSGRIALITGSTAGIGKATAAGLAAAGADVVVNGRNAARVDEVAKSLGVRGIAADVGTAAGVASLIEQLPDVDVLVNNTGVYSPIPVFETPDDEWLRLYQINVLSGVRLTRHYAPGMRDRGWGRVIFVSGVPGIQPATDMIHYSMTKTAQLALSRGMAQELAGTGVTVNSVVAGPTLTERARDVLLAMNPELAPDEAERRFVAPRKASLLLGRMIRPEEVANLITYVASEEAAATTGGALRVDGGVISSILP